MNRKVCNFKTKGSKREPLFLNQPLDDLKLDFDLEVVTYAEKKSEMDILVQKVGKQMDDI